MVTIGGVVERPGLVDDANAGLLRLDDDFLDVVDATPDRLVQRHSRFDRGLRVELRREGDLEQDIFHHVATVQALERERFAFEQHVVIAPHLCGQRGRIAHFTAHRDQRQAHRPAGRVARRPALARPRVRGVAIGPQGPAVDPRMRQRVQHLVAIAAEHARHHGGRRDPHEQYVIQPDTVVAVLERQAALDLMRLDHRGQHVLHRQRRFPGGTILPAQVIGNREDAAEVVGRMTPLGRQPGVVEIEPANHCADAEGRHDGLQFIRCAGHARAPGQRRSGHDRAEQLRAGRVVEGLETTGEGVHQAVVCGLESEFAVDVDITDVICDIRQLRVPVGPLRGASSQVRHVVSRLVDIRLVAILDGHPLLQ